MWGSKKKQPEATGFMGDMNEAQEKGLQEFKQYIQESGITTHPQFDDYYLLRFLRARKFDQDKTKLMFTNFLTWRQENDADNIIENYHFEEEKLVLEVYPHGYHKVDKKGRPIYIERQGFTDMDKLFKITTEERLLKHYIHSYELLVRLRFPACSAAFGSRIEQGCNIMDLTNASMKLFSSKARGFVQLASKIGQDYYPEIMGQMFIVNAPMLFTGVWAVIKGFLDEKTRNKIKILGGGFKKDLLEVIEAENLPDFLGGTCTCSEYGGCMFSNLGPWNDYELITPVGIKRRHHHNGLSNGEASAALENGHAEHTHDKEEEKANMQ